jgi:hypothetical protein
MRAWRFHRPFGSSQSRSRRHQLFLGRLVPLLCSRIEGACGSPPGNRAPGRNASRSLAACARSVVLSRRSRRTAVSYIARSRCKVASCYRIAFAVPERIRAAYLALGHPDPAKTGSKGWMLPIPATYVLNSTGLAVLSYLDADYTTRLEATEVIATLTHLRAASIPARNNR